jgi:hypothetical protein
VRFELRLRGRFGERQAQLGETEIQNLEATVVGDEEIGGLQIAMNNRVIVGSDESRDKLKGEIEEFGFREGTGGELGAERTARNVFHYQEIGAALSIEIVNGGDIGMIEFRKRAGLIVETMASGFISDGAGMEKLKSNVAVKVGIAGQINDTHAAAANFVEDVVVAEF